MTKRQLLKLTAKDFRWDYYVGTGKGGQNRNKTENCCRCTHEPSGAVGKSEEGRSKEQNRKKAFERMATSPEFKKWIRNESLRLSGELALIDAKVDRQLFDTKVQIQDEKGKWIDAPKEMQVSQWDIKNSKD